MRYVSTSDEDDNDVDDDEDSSEYDSEDENPNDEEEKEQSQRQEPVNASNSEEVKAESSSEAGNKTQKPENDQVPEIARKIIRKNLQGKEKRQPQIRYVYTHVPGQDGPPKKTAVIKKAITREPAKDLVQILIEKKQSVYAREQHMLQMREEQDRNYKESTTEF